MKARQSWMVLDKWEVLAEAQMKGPYACQIYHVQKWSDTDLKIDTEMEVC
jgi:hypothetical protein